MIWYRREPLPAPLKALAWEEPGTVVVVIDNGLTTGEARAAAVAAIRRLHRGRR